MDDARAWYDNTCERRKNQDAEQFVLMHAEDLVGTMIVFNYSEQTQSAEIGYVLGQPFWGKGYMQEALTEFIPMVKSALEITQLCANVDRENTKSANLLARLNFAYTRSDTEPDGVLLDTFTRKFY